MSELAFNLSGERFELPVKATGWRVRRLKAKGAPEVVYGRSGIPLILPIDADIEDLRLEARMEGRYRLDPVDENGRVIEATSAGYVCVQPSDAGAQASDRPDPAFVVGKGPSENPLIEGMRLNTELARTIIDKFPMMLESAAVLLRAADGAGMPARPPRAIAGPEETPDNDDDDDDDDEQEDAEESVEPAPKATGWASLAESLVPFIAPAIVSAITSGKLSIPGGAGALFDCRRANPKAEAQVEPTAGPAGDAPVPRPQYSAPTKRVAWPARSAAAPTSAPRGYPAGAAAASARLPNAPPSARRAPSPAVGDTVHARVEDARAGVPRVRHPRLGDGRATARSGGQPQAEEPQPEVYLEPPGVGDAYVLSPDSAEASSAEGELYAESTSRMGAEEVADSGSPLNDQTPRAAHRPTAMAAMDALPTLDPAALAHFAAIQGALTLRESMLARALAAELTPADLRTWLAELREMSVPAAIAKIRNLLGTLVGETGAGESSNTPGAAS